MRLGNTLVPCAVLADQTRVVSERALVKSFGGKRGGAHWLRLKHQDEAGANLPVILSANNLRPFISSDLMAALKDRRLYIGKGMGAPSHGLKAEVYPLICEVFLDADRANALRGVGQKNFAIQADILLRALAKTGITALIDEATGFEKKRPQNALQEILDMYTRSIL